MAPELPIDVLKVDHVALATWDITGSVRLFTEVLGGEFVDGGDDPRGGFRWLQFQLPGGKVELLEPLTTDSFLYRFLTKRGEGMHHVTLYVKDLADAIPTLTSAGYEPVDVFLDFPQWKEAFLHPRDTSGVLIQLAEVPDHTAPTRPPRPLDEYLADRPGLKPA